MHTYIKMRIKIPPSASLDRKKMKKKDKKPHSKKKNLVFLFLLLSKKWGRDILATQPNIGGVSLLHQDKARFSTAFVSSRQIRGRGLEMAFPHPVPKRGVGEK